MNRLAAYFMFASALFEVPGIAVAEDLAAGDASFHKWGQACHAVGVGAKNKLGPELNDLAGRRAGTAEGYHGLASVWNAAAPGSRTALAVNSRA